MRASSMVLAILALLTVAAGHAADDDAASGTLTNCTISQSGGTFEEACDLESADPILAGTWSFRYRVDESDEGVYVADDGEERTTFEYESDDLVLQVGQIVIVTDDGAWEGEGQRVLSAGQALDDFWEDVLNVPGGAGGGAWVIGGHLEGGDTGYEGLELQIGGAGDDAGPPYAIHGLLDSGSGYSTAANIARVVFPLIVFALLVAGAVISFLKGHWWQGILGVMGFGVYALWSTQVSLDLDVLGRFEENVENNIGLAIFIASSAGALLLLLGAVLPARPGSWWHRHRTVEAADA